MPESNRRDLIEELLRQVRSLPLHEQVDALIDLYASVLEVLELWEIQDLRLDLIEAGKDGRFTKEVSEQLCEILDGHLVLREILGS